MHITCVICSEMFTENSEAYATSCGHIFHNPCLQHWFENSKTCPQCRRRLNTRELVKLYMNITTTMDGGLDVSVINDKLQNAQHDIHLKDNELKVLSDKISELKKENLSLITVKIDYATKLESQKSTINNIKDKLNHFKDQARNCEVLRQENAELKRRLQNLDHINVALKGSQEEVRNLIHNENNIENLAVVTAALKKSLVESDKKNKVLQTQVKKAQIETFHVKKELSKAQDECNTLKAELNILKAKKGPLNKDHLRIKNCNQATRATTTVDLTNSPSPSNSSVVEVENSPLPPSSLGIFQIQRGLSNKTASSRTIFITESASAAAGRPTYKRPNMMYDGLGGSKQDDIFPTGERKRAKVSADKMKKLSAQAGKPGKK